MNYFLVAGVILFIILISIQYSLNKIIILLKEIKDLIYKVNLKNKNSD